MLEPFRSLRFKLTAIYIAVFGVLQLALWLTVDTIRVNGIRDQFDQQLIAFAQSVVKSIDSVAELAGPAAQGEHVAVALRPYDVGKYYFEVRFADPSISFRSSNLRGIELGLGGNESLPAPAVPQVQSVDGQLARALGQANAPFRVLSLVEEAPGNRPYTLRVAASAAGVERAIWEVRQLLIVFTLLSLALAGLALWYVAWRTLAPLEAIASQLRGIAAGALDRRIDVSTSDRDVQLMVDAVNDALDRVKAEMERRKRFISEVSHELKTPLSVLLGEAKEVSGSPNSSKDPVEFARHVERDLRGLLRTIEGFLIMAQVRGPRLTVTTAISLEELVIASIQRCRREAEQEGVRLVPQFLQTDELVEPVVFGDFDLLRSVLENLFHNAIRYSSNGDTVSVVVEVSGNEAKLMVQDNGPGIGEDDLPHIFEASYQGMRSGKRQGSAGLGLAIAKSVTELHGGEISARNRPEGGSEFIVRLPLAPAYSNV